MGGLVWGQCHRILSWPHVCTLSSGARSECKGRGVLAYIFLLLSETLPPTVPFILPEVGGVKLGDRQAEDDSEDLVENLKTFYGHISVWGGEKATLTIISVLFIWRCFLDRNQFVWLNCSHPQRP